MATNHHPQHPQNPAHQPDHSGHSNEPVLKATTDKVTITETNAALALIRRKLSAIYGDEPDAKQEMAESLQANASHSRHQQFMSKLHDSGRTAAQIQTEWHQYYQNLDDAGKHEVWQEFYSHSAKSKQQKPAPVQSPAQPEPVPQAEYKRQYEPEPFKSVLPQASHEPVAAAPVAAGQPTPNPFYAAQPTAVTAVPAPAPDTRQPDAIKQQLRSKVSSRGRLKAKHHIQSLLFGLGFGALTLLVVLFSFFNEVVIAPFIQPSRQVSATPIIVSPDGVTPSDKNEVIIPKINVQIPLDFSAKSTNEKEFESALDKGVAHYPTTTLPGEKGNTSFFGHSSNNIFNPGKYKFAFVLLNELNPGDTFYITYNGVAYSYQVYDKKIVAATAVEILNPVPDKSSTAMLVTCDPPGTSLRRLVIWGEQVSPNPNSNIAATNTPASNGSDTTKVALPGNGPTLWGRFINFVGGGGNN